MPTDSKIHLLPPHIADRIAAGEVVDRPASVVKELIENSLDAGAAAISVEIRNGGLSLMRVSDDGSGMDADDAALAVARFSTSKIRTANDLDAITTLGFRGEALASMAAVARLEILTRTREALEGCRVLAAEGAIESRAAGSPAGCSVAVTDLFYNTPARRKFLKSPMRESQLVRDVVVRYALAYPGVAFRLLVNGKESFVAPPASTLERMSVALGRDAAQEMLDVHWEAADLRVSGHISSLATARRDRKGQFFFVNGRPVRSGLLAVMLERPYAGRLPLERRPLAVLHIRVDPHLVDVNVHPRKDEIRLSQERSVYGAVSRAVEEALVPFPQTVQDTTGIAWPFAENGGAFAGLRETAPGYSAGGMEPLGQLDNAYIVARSREGLVVMDQHAAHEQVLFEGLLAGGESRPLTPPFQTALTRQEAELLEPFLPALAEIGLEVDPFGSNTFLVRSLPAALAHAHPRQLLDGLLDELPGCRSLDPEDVRERLAAKAACTAALKAGDILGVEEMRRLLHSFEAAWSPATCPHGRPAFVLLTTDELERRFMRR